MPYAIYTYTWAMDMCVLASVISYAHCHFNVGYEETYVIPNGQVSTNLGLLGRVIWEHSADCFGSVKWFCRLEIWWLDPKKIFLFRMTPQYPTFISLPVYDGVFFVYWYYWCVDVILYPLSKKSQSSCQPQWEYEYWYWSVFLISDMDYP